MVVGSPQISTISVMLELFNSVASVSLECLEYSRIRITVEGILNIHRMMKARNGRAIMSEILTCSD